MQTFHVIDGSQVSEISISDRGLSYGDGIFETVRYASLGPVLPDYHLDRFKHGADVLSIPFPDSFQQKLQSALELWEENRQTASDFICKWMLTRGAGGRGYVPGSTISPTLIFSFFSAPDYPPQYTRVGVDTMLCAHPLSINKVLAGIKHLNRLDQVIASNELNTYPEGVMCDSNGYVVEGTKSNLLLFKGNRVISPLLDCAGVTGTMLRFLESELIVSHPELSFERKKVKPHTLFDMDGLAFVNSVFGIWPILSVDSREFKVTDSCRLISLLIQDHLGI